jgi:hypothetical protein
MYRKEFLKTIWRKGIKPTLLIVVIYFCVKFLINVFQDNETERFIIILALELGILFAIIYLIGFIFSSIISKINSKLPDSVKPWLKKITKVLNYIEPIISGIIFYQFWKKDWITAALLIGIILILRITEIIEKKTGHNT